MDNCLIASTKQYDSYINVRETERAIKNGLPYKHWRVRIVRIRFVRYFVFLFCMLPCSVLLLILHPIRLKFRLSFLSFWLFLPGLVLSLVSSVCESRWRVTQWQGIYSFNDCNSTMRRYSRCDDNCVCIRKADDLMITNSDTNNFSFFSF